MLDNSVLGSLPQEAPLVAFADWWRLKLRLRPCKRILVSHALDDRPQVLLTRNKGSLYLVRLLLHSCFRVADRLVVLSHALMHERNDQIVKVVLLSLFDHGFSESSDKFIQKQLAFIGRLTVDRLDKRVRLQLLEDLRQWRRLIQRLPELSQFLDSCTAWKHAKKKEQFETDRF